MNVYRKIRYIPILNPTLAFLLFFIAKPGCADGVDGALEERSLGTLSLSLHVTESGIFIINPGTPMAMRPDFIVERLNQSEGTSGRPGLAICLVGSDSNQLQVDTVLINETGTLQQASVGVQLPFFVAVGSDSNFTNRARIRVVDDAECSNSNALNVIVIEPVATLARQGALPISNFRLLIQAE